MKLGDCGIRSSLRGTFESWWCCPLWGLFVFSVFILFLSLVIDEISKLCTLSSINNLLTVFDTPIPIVINICKASPAASQFIYLFWLSGLSLSSPNLHPFTPYMYCIHLCWRKCCFSWSWMYEAWTEIYWALSNPLEILFDSIQPARKKVPVGWQCRECESIEGLRGWKGRQPEAGQGTITSWRVLFLLWQGTRFRNNKKHARPPPQPCQWLCPAPRSCRLVTSCVYQPRTWELLERIGRKRNAGYDACWLWRARSDFAGEFSDDVLFL